MRIILIVVILALAACQQEVAEEISPAAPVVDEPPPLLETASSQQPKDSVIEAPELEKIDSKAADLKKVELMLLDLSIPRDAHAQLNSGPLESYDQSRPNFFETTVKKKSKTSISGSIIQDEERRLDIDGVKGAQITIKTEFD